ncbi:MAG: autotransporter-associated beta strand repeat-containing protein [Luteolibacter sp.]
MNINTSGTVNSNGQMLIAGKSGDVATANLDAGTVTIHGGWQDSVRIACIAGASTNSTGSLNMSGGTLTLDHRLVIGTGSTTSSRTGSGTPEDPYSPYTYVYADGSTSGTVTMTGGTITCNTVYNTIPANGNEDAQNWHAGVNMASGYDGSIGGTATFNLDGGTLSTVSVFSEAGSGNDGNGDPFFSQAGISTFNFNGGTLKGQAAPQGWLSLMGGLTRANVRDGGAIVDTNGNNTFISQMLAHSDIDGDAAKDGGLTKKGLGQLDVAGGYTYTGDTRVNAGTLMVHSASFDDTSTVRIAAGATLNLNTFGATDTVGSLVLAGATQSAGTYGATGSGAEHETSLITGSGFITVADPAGAYTSWANANGATGETLDQDHDNDGVKNGVEYFMGQTGSSFTANPAPVSGAVTWPMGVSYSGVYGTDYEVQYSTDLVTWTTANQGTGANTVTVTTGTSVVYHMPTGGKNFVRLIVKN